MNYSYNEMKRAFECGRNFQLTGENNFSELIKELHQANKISSNLPVSGSLPEKVKELLLFTEEDGTVVNGFRTKEIINELRALAGNDR